MTIFNDADRTIEISINTWDETRGQWSPDWSEDFYDAVAKDVTDVQYCIDQATDMRDGKGDYADGDPHPDVAVTVTELDHDEYMRGHIRDLWYGDAELDGISEPDDAVPGFIQSIDCDQVMSEGRPAYDMYRFVVGTAQDDPGVDYVLFDITPEEMAAFVNDEFDDPDHATRVHPGVHALNPADPVNLVMPADDANVMGVAL